MVSGLLRTLAHRRRSPAALLKLFNNVLRERIVEAQYVALTVLVWENTARRFVMANAGAAPPIICRHGELIKPRVEGVPAGLLDDRDYEEVILEAQQDDLLLLYSDGITDQLNGSGEDYGRHRLPFSAPAVRSRSGNGSRPDFSRPNRVHRRCVR